MSAAGVALNALTALAGHARAGRVRWPCATLFAITGSAGAWFGSSLAKMIDGHQLLLIFAGAMAAVGLAMLRPKVALVRPGPQLIGRCLRASALAGAGVGSAAGFFGIGGGFLIVPGLMASTDMNLATAQATSLLSVAAFGATTAGNYALSGWLDWSLVAAMATGGIVGTLAGLPLAQSLAWPVTSQSGRPQAVRRTCLWGHSEGAVLAVIKCRSPGYRPGPVNSRA